MEDSKIQWTDHTFNPWVGCTKVSPGCANCYAENLMDTRYQKVKWGKGNPRTLTSEDNWKNPYKWNRKAQNSCDRPRVFCASLADVFDPEVDQEWRDRLWKVIDECSNLDWLLLTKRLNVLSADELLGMLPEEWRSKLPDHIWFGHSICTQSEADKVIPKLIQIPANIRFLSMEPLIESIDLLHAFAVIDSNGEPLYPRCNPDGSPVIDWVIVGGESGASARPFDIAWARAIIEDCSEAGVEVFVKQLGSNPKVQVHSVHRPPMNWVDFGSTGKGADPEEWPDDLRVRNFPSRSMSLEVDGEECVK